MLSLATPIPLSLYIHIPWCVQKCPYCDFNSHQIKNTIPEADYIATLIRDLDENIPAIWGRSLVSIFLGGGTPSVFSPKAIETLLTALHSRLRFSNEIEITLEANPGTIDEDRFRGFRAAGINRLSIGVQSLQNSKLAALGRIHDKNRALSAIEQAQNSGFDNFNLDLMYGLPGQSLDDAMEDLETALQYHPPHLSWYQLTIEPNTFFYHQPPILPQDDTIWEIQQAGIALLAKNELQHYEVSAFAKAGYASVHNTNYWQFGDYLGIGAGAHSKITTYDNHCVTRHWQVKHPTDYLNPAKKLTAETTILQETDLIFEFMLNALRLQQGVPRNFFSERTGLPLTRIEPLIKEAQHKKLLSEDPHVLCATPFGQRFLNNLVALFLPESTNR